MPLITIAISDGEENGEGDGDGDRDWRLAAKNASQDITLCALCNASSNSNRGNNSNVNPTYVQYLPLPLSSIVRRDSPLRLCVNRLFIHNYIIYRLINSTRNYFN